jgi:hypothetical protein
MGMRLRCSHRHKCYHCHCHTHTYTHIHTHTHTHTPTLSFLSTTTSSCDKAHEFVRGYAQHERSESGPVLLPRCSSTVVVVRLVVTRNAIVGHLKLLSASEIESRCVCDATVYLWSCVFVSMTARVNIACNREGGVKRRQTRCKGRTAIVALATPC